VESLSDLPIANSYKAAPLATKCEPGSLRWQQDTRWGELNVIARGKEWQ
jgi:hypothetical protein